MTEFRNEHAFKFALVISRSGLLNLEPADPGQRVARWFLNLGSADPGKRVARGFFNLASAECGPSQTLVRGSANEYQKRME